jgi:hypothetical protein
LLKSQHQFPAVLVTWFSSFQHLHFLRDLDPLRAGQLGDKSGIMGCVHCESESMHPLKDLNRYVLHTGKLVRGVAVRGVAVRGVAVRGVARRDTCSHSRT